jgi:hypothetical protein
MIRLHEFKDNGLEVNWGTILIGLDGPGKLPPQIIPKEVVDYAVELISQSNNQPDSIWILADLSENDTSEIKRLVWELEKGEKLSREVEIDKWKVLLLQRILSELNNEPIYDLLKLTEFWEKFDYPKDSPHIVQGLHNDISPTDYYTEENYKEIVKNHKLWIEAKLSQLGRM